MRLRKEERAFLLAVLREEYDDEEDLLAALWRGMSKIVRERQWFFVHSRETEGDKGYAHGLFASEAEARKYAGKHPVGEHRIFTVMPAGAQAFSRPTHEPICGDRCFHPRRSHGKSGCDYLGCDCTHDWRE